MLERRQLIRASAGKHSAWLWLGAALLLIALVGVVSARQSPQPAELSPRDASATGGLALYLWLQRLGYLESDVTGSALDLGSAVPNTSTLLLTPSADLTGEATGTALAWVRRGGRLVLTTDGSSGSNLLSAVGFRVVAAPTASVNVWQPLLLAPPTLRLAGSTDTVVADVPPGADVAGTTYGPAVLQLPLGRGEVWLLTAPTLLDNAGLRNVDNRDLALNLAGPRGTRVIFDEYSPAAPVPASDWLTTTVWGVLVLFLPAAILLYRWLAGRRLGPPLIPLKEQHRAATEYVISIARLLQLGHKRVDTLATYQRQLRRVLRERFGRRELEALSSEKRAEVERLLTAPQRLSEQDLIRRAAEIVQCEDDVRSHRV